MRDDLPNVERKQILPCTNKPINGIICDKMSRTKSELIINTSVKCKNNPKRKENKCNKGV